MANTFKFGNGKWAVKDGAALAYNDENDNYKPLPFDFTRASSATRVNREGLIEVVGQNKPRVDFLNNTSGHLLLEPSRMNVITDSEISSTTPTTAGDGTYEDTTLSNGLSGKKFDITSSGRSFVIFTSSVSSGVEYTLSLFAENFSGDSISNFVDVISGGGGEDFSSDLISDGKMEVSFTTTATSVTIRIGLGCTATLSGTRSVEISGVQLEAGSYATSYIPTEGSNVTRSADECFQSGLTDKGILNNSALTLYFETDIQSDTSINYQEIIALYNDANSVNLRLETRTTNQLYVQHTGVVSSGSNFNNLSLGANSINLKKIAIYLTTTQFKIFADGSQLYSTYNGTYNLDFDRIGFRIYNNPVETLIKNKEIKLYNTALSDSELQALTS
jgi:hypothetical protein